MIWTPHATVAVIVEKDGKFLLVKELSHGKIVFNQPAGHVEEGESIFDAATRETLEESGWKVELDSLIGLYTYKAPANGVTYYRICFSAKPIAKVSVDLDSDIISEQWLSYGELTAIENQLRSPLVKRCIDDFLANKRFPLSLIYETPDANI